MRAESRSDSAPPCGLIVADLALRWRVSGDKIRAWIRTGALKAVNTASFASRRPRWVVTRESVAEFEQRRAGGPPPKPNKRKRRSQMVDYYPDG
jgi:hypothetical protein